MHSTNRPPLIEVFSSFNSEKMEVHQQMQQQQQSNEASQSKKRLFLPSLHHSSKVDETQLFNSLTESIYHSPSSKMELNMQRFEDSQPKLGYSSPLSNRKLNSSKIDETQLINLLPESIYDFPNPKMEVNMQRIEEDSLLKHSHSSPVSNRTVNSSSIEVSSSSPTITTKSSPISSPNALIKAIFRDDKTSLITQADQLSASQPIDRATASRLLHICCEFDAAEAAAALLNGEVCGVIPLINEVDVSTGYAPLHTAAENHAVKCIELIIRKRGRTDIKTRKGAAGLGNGNGGGRGRSSTSTGSGSSVLPLELSLRCVRMEIKWGPDDPLDDLLLILSEKDLRAISALSDKTKETAEVAYRIAMEGRVAALAALLMVAADKVNGSVLEVRNRSELAAEKTTVYSCVIKEATSIFSSSQDKHKDVEEIDHKIYHGVGAMERRTLLLREIELLQFFGASHTNNSGCMGKKVTSPLILASQAGDEEVMKLILKTDIDVNEVDAEGNSALHWCLKASKLSSPEQMRILLLLLKRGARTRQKDKLGLTAVHIAAGNGNLEALEILLPREPDSINTKSELKETPLFLAVKNDLIECAQLLLRFGASTEVHNLRRERPIELAKSQQMRSALNRTSVVITNRDSKQKYTVQNDEVVSTREVLLKEAWSSSESDNSNSVSDICKYFTSASGCARGSNCFYKHGEDELSKRSRNKYARSLALQEFKKKVFVGGLPAAIDSESLACIIEDKYGPVIDAKVLEMEIDGQVISRGFGFVTFDDEKSVAAALEAHYTDILGKKVEMKTAIPQCLLSHDDSDDESPQGEEAVQVSIQPKTSIIDMSAGDEKSEQMSWASRLSKAQPKESVNERKVPRKSSDMPKWLLTFKKWLPNFLNKMSRNAPGEYYSLSSVKTDFKALFGLDLDHASIGYPKLSEFVKSCPELCSVKFINTGGLVPNHMILLPPKVKVSCPPPLIVSKKEFPKLSSTSPLQEHDDDKDSKSDSLDVLVDPLPSDCAGADLTKRGSDNDSPSSSTLATSPDARDGNTFVGEAVTTVKPSSTDTVPDTNPRFLQFLEPDPIFVGRTWRGNGGFKVPHEHFRPQHLILEHLAQKKGEVFFLRSIKFYNDYANSVRRGSCFGCGDSRLVWANYPCEHLLWCSDCKFNAMRIAEVGTLSHKCVVCDIVVQKIDLIQWTKLQFRSYEDMESPPVHSACLRSQQLRV